MTTRKGLYAIFFGLMLLLACFAPPAHATDEDDIRAAWTAAIAAYNAKQLDTLMGYFSQSYLDDGEDWNAKRMKFQAEFNDPNWQPASITVTDVLLTGVDTATVRVSDPHGEGIEYMRKEGAQWRVYGNQLKHRCWVFSQHWSNGYYAAIGVEDNEHKITSAAATGPGITGTLNLTYGPQKGQWWGDSNPFLDTGLPATFPTYIITVTDATGTYTYERTITGYVEPFASNLAPVGGVSGSLSFSWMGIPNANRYWVELRDNAGNDAWQSQEIYPNPSNHYSVTYTGPALTAGHTYTYLIVSSVDTNDSGNMSFAQGSFTYNSSTISVSAVIYDVNGAPVPGVTVQMVGNAAVSTTTGTDGAFTLNGLPGGTIFQLQFTKAGYEKVYTTNISSTANITNVFWTLLPAGWRTSIGNDAGKGAITGRTTDNNDRSAYISGVVISAVNQAVQNLPVNYPGNPDNTGTVIEGRFLVKNITPGDVVTVTGTKNGIAFAPRTHVAFADGVTQGSLPGSPNPANTAWFTGWVRDFVSGTTVSGAAVQLASDPAKTTQSTADGSFTLAALPKNTPITFKATKTGYSPTYIPAQIGGNVYSAYIPFPLITAAQLTTWGNTSGKGVICGRVSYITNGNFNASDVTVTVTGTLHGSYPVYYQAGPSSPLDSGAPATYAGGRFWVLNVEPGDTVTINASRPGFSFTPATVTPPGDGVTAYKYAGTATAYISGSVKDLATGAALSNALVTVKDAANNPAGSVYTASDGTFFLGVGALGNYSLTASKAGYGAPFPQVFTLGTAGQTYDVGALYMDQQGGSATLSLSPSWNLVSLPLQPDNASLSSVLSGIAGSYQVVWGYANQAWKFYNPANPQGSTLATMEAGKGYWIKMTEAKTLSVTGSAPPSSLSLPSGWNLVGYNGTACTAATGALSSLSGNLQVSWGYPGQAWKFYNPQNVPGSTLTQFCPNYGYWIKVTEGGTWVLP